MIYGDYGWLWLEVDEKSDVKWRSYAWNVWIPVGDLQSSRASSRFAEPVRIDSHQPNYYLQMSGWWVWTGLVWGYDG
jgi:hypothetical protein